MSAIETIAVENLKVRCDGGGGPLGHPRVYLHIEVESGKIVCPYCSRTYVLKPGARAVSGH